MKPPEVVLPPALKGRLAAGHPWVYRNQIASLPAVPDGAWVRVRAGNFTSFGLWENTGQIAIRLFSPHGVPDAAWVLGQVRRAWELRAPLRDQDISAYRWIFGEADGLPGITVDLYSAFAVVQMYSAGVTILLPWLVEALRSVAPLRGIALRRREAEAAEGGQVEVERVEGGKIEAVWGKLPPRDLVVQEYGLRFYANLFAGQKTGLFLDQRENRRFLESWCQDRTVLNCFSYTGAFSLYAARGGASSVTSCDSAPATAEAAAANFALNGFNPHNYAFVVEDCFALLARLAQEGQAFDLVILDPPSFAHTKKHIHAALRGYTRLHQLALRCVRPGGLLAAASCTSYVTPDLFRQTLSDAATSVDRRLLILHEAGQPLDHPVPAHFPEGRYLKFVLCAVEKA
ncbi:MAG TPA: class I SAM-dependent rRNA methyltransferase [Ktedonobacterales bacterium]|jgi:23S rRNA (cytosine1962-C5)-methyltransferase